MAAVNLVSTLLMGALLLVIALGINGVRSWRRQETAVLRPEPSGDLLARIARNPATWTLVFVVLVLGFGTAAILYVGGEVAVSVPSGVAFLFLVAGFGAVLVAFLFLGVYYSARARGMNSAPAAGVSSAVVGLLFISAVVAQLLLA